MTGFDSIQKSHGVLYDTKVNATAPGLTHPHGRHDSGKLSRLESLQVDFQKRLLKEKEEKLIKKYEQNRIKIMARLTNNEPSSPQDLNSDSGRKSVRDFFNERRRMEANGAPMPPIQNHYNSAANRIQSSRENSSNQEIRKMTFGGHRFQPLAPIKKHQPEQETTNNTRSEVHNKSHVVDNVDKEDKSLNGRAPLEVLKSIPSASHHSGDDETNSVSTNVAPSRFPLQRNQSRLLTTKLQMKPKLQPESASVNFELQASDEALQAKAKDKLTDYQRWKMNQLKPGDEQHKQIKNNKPNKNERSRPQTDSSLSDGYGKRNNIDDEPEDNITRNDHTRVMKADEIEHVTKKAGNQIEVNTTTNDTEKGTFEMRQQQKKKGTAQKRQENTTQDERKDAKYQKQRENKILLERRESHENDGEWKTSEKSVQHEGTGRSKEIKLGQQHEHESSLAKPSHNKDNYDNNYMLHQEPPFSTKQNPNFSKNSKKPQPPISKIKVTPPDVHDVSISYAGGYEDTSNEDASVMSDLAECHLCGRSFLPERLQKHEAACAKANKPRKEFDSSKKRVEGTEHAKFVSKAKREEPQKKKSNWRSKHEDFIQSLQYARKVTQHEKEGLDPRQLTPPAATKNPDYVQCPHCERSFNVTAAERHIPRCQSLKTRPPPKSTKHR